MRKASIVGSLVLMLTLFSGLVSAENVVDDSKKPQYLFTLASKSGTFKGDTLTLKGVPLVVYFSDRPVRVAGHITLEEFLGMWDMGVDNFKNNPPNLAIYEENGDKHAVLIITKPEVKGDNISFKVKLIGENIPESFEHSTLFIDGSNYRVNPQILD